MIPRHQWTHDGAEVLIVRQCAKDGASSHGFRYPLTAGAVVEAPDWNPALVCGGGLHGWPWGFAIGDGALPDYAATWLVLAAATADVVGGGGDLTGKCKCRRATVRYVGAWHGALAMVRAGHIAWTMQAATSGHQSSAATSGYLSSAATSGDRSSAATSGYQASAATSGDKSSAATSGYQSAAATSGDYSSAASTGAASVAVCAGIDSRAMAGDYGCIALAWWHEAEQRAEMRCARTGPGHLKPHTWYRLDAAGEFVEVTP